MSIKEKKKKNLKKGESNLKVICQSTLKWIACSLIILCSLFLHLLRARKHLSNWSHRRLMPVSTSLFKELSFEICKYQIKADVYVNAKSCHCHTVV